MKFFEKFKASPEDIKRLDKAEEDFYRAVENREKALRRLDNVDEEAALVEAERRASNDEKIRKLKEKVAALQQELNELNRKR